MKWHIKYSSHSSSLPGGQIVSIYLHGIMRKKIRKSQIATHTHVEEIQGGSCIMELSYWDHHRKLNMKTHENQERRVDNVNARHVLIMYVYICMHESNVYLPLLNFARWDIHTYIHTFLWVGLRYHSFYFSYYEMSLRTFDYRKIWDFYKVECSQSQIAKYMYAI